MALIQCNFFSHVLDLSTSMYVILPQTEELDLQKPEKRVLYPTLYLLHGLSDDCSIWMRNTSIERYVKGLGLAVVMPEVQRSFYTDMVSGLPYWTFISEELPRICRSLFPLSPRRKDNFVAGLSMGGYGAFKLALSLPNRFAAAASLSGALDISDSIRDPDPDYRAEMKLIFGRLKNITGSENDLFALADRLSSSRVRQPKFYQWCGTEDFLYGENLRFRDHARSLGLDLTYEEGPGEHEWGAWDRQIQRVLEWLPLH